MYRVTGEVVRFERRPWSMNGQSGVSREARVLVGRADFCDVRIPEDWPDPREGESVDWAVVLRARGDRITATLRGRFLDLVPDAVSA